MTRRWVVALRALGLGDLLVAVPALRALDRAFPEHGITLLAPEALEPLARHAARIDRVVHADHRLTPPADLPRVAADVAVNLHGQGPGSARALGELRPGRLLAYGTPGAPPWRPDEPERVRWCRLLAAYGIPADADDLLLDPLPRPSGAGTYTVIHPGAAAAARRWPAPRWSTVTAALADAGRTVVLTGSAAEQPLAAHVAAVARASGALPGAVRVEAGRTSALGVACLVGGAELVLSTDTGVAHLASALARPSVVLFGPSAPSRWGPPALPRHQVLWAGALGDPHGRLPDPGLLDISVDDVLSAAALARTAH